MVATSIWQALGVALFTTIVGALLAWFVGTYVGYVWDERKRRRESDLAALATFYELYGKFFSTWKLWSAHRRDDTSISEPEHLQWRLLERAEEVEGGFEALLVKLVAERSLDTEARELLGCFREAYQTLRERIRDNKTLDWLAVDEHAGEGYDQYRAFKALTTYVAFLLEASPRQRFRPGVQAISSDEAIEAFYAVTDGIYRGTWWELAADRFGLNERVVRGNA